MSRGPLKDSLLNFSWYFSHFLPSSFTFFEPSRPGIRNVENVKEKGERNVESDGHLSNEERGGKKLSRQFIWPGTLLSVTVSVPAVIRRPVSSLLPGRQERERVTLLGAGFKQEMDGICFPSPPSPSLHPLLHHHEQPFSMRGLQKGENCSRPVKMCLTKQQKPVFLHFLAWVSELSLSWKEQNHPLCQFLSSLHRQVFSASVFVLYIQPSVVIIIILISIPSSTSSSLNKNFTKQKFTVLLLSLPRAVVFLCKCTGKLRLFETERGGKEDYS